MWGLINYGAANRHHKRYIAVMGIATKAASMAKVVFGAGGLILLLLVAMLINSTYPWWTGGPHWRLSRVPAEVHDHLPQSVQQDRGP